MKEVPASFPSFQAFRYHDCQRSGGRGQPLWLSLARLYQVPESEGCSGGNVHVQQCRTSLVSTGTFFFFKFSLQKAGILEIKEAGDDPSLSRVQ